MFMLDEGLDPVAVTSMKWSKEEGGHGIGSSSYPG